jgi:hypothetical protein
MPKHSPLAATWSELDTRMMDRTPVRGARRTGAWRTRFPDRLIAAQQALELERRRNEGDVRLFSQVRRLSEAAGLGMGEVDNTLPSKVGKPAVDQAVDN